MASAVLRIFGVYILVESAAVAGLIWAIGFGRTTLVLLGVFLAGLMLSAAQIRRQVGRLRSGAGQRVLADGGLIAAGTLLVFVPGPVTTLAGLLLLTPPTRTAARPLLAAVATAALGRHTPLVTAAVVGRRWYSTRRAPGRRVDHIDHIDYIDADFVDVTEISPPALPVG